MKRIRNIIIVVVALVAIVAFAAFSGKKHSNAIEVRTATVTLGTFVNKLPESGTVILPGTQTVPTLVAGNIGDLNVHAGDRVGAGEVLATIENPTLQSNAAGTQADYSSAAANVDVARVNEDNARVQYQAGVETQRTSLAEARRIYEADRALLSQKAIARTTVDADKAKLDQAQVAYDQAVSQYRLGAVSGYGQNSVQYAQAAAQKARILNDQAQQQLQFTRITAPFSGTIMSVATQQSDATRPLQPGDPVTAGQSLFTIASNQGYTVRAQVDEQDIINVHVGQHANVSSQNFPNQTIPGHVSVIAPLATKSTDASSTAKQVLTTIALDRSPPFLKDGMSVDVDILTQDIPHAIVVPAAAVSNDKAGSYVWVVAAGKAVRRKVLTGAANDTQVVVRSGLRPRDVIVSERNPAVTAGAAVTPAPSPSTLPPSGS